MVDKTVKLGGTLFLCPCLWEVIPESLAAHCEWFLPGQTILGTSRGVDCDLSSLSPQPHWQHTCLGSRCLWASLGPEMKGVITRGHQPYWNNTLIFSMVTYIFLQNDPPVSFVVPLPYAVWDPTFVHPVWFWDTLGPSSTFSIQPYFTQISRLHGLAKFIFSEPCN